jgi:hypothetical protein
MFDKLKVPQLLNKLPTIYKIRIFPNVLTSPANSEHPVYHPTKYSFIKLMVFLALLSFAKLYDHFLRAGTLFAK